MRETGQKFPPEVWERALRLVREARRADFRVGSHLRLSAPSR
jgi:hypothetical protein